MVVCVLGFLAFMPSAGFWAGLWHPWLSAPTALGSCSAQWVLSHSELRNQIPAQPPWPRFTEHEGFPSPSRQGCTQGLPALQNPLPTFGAAVPTSHLREWGGIFSCCWVSCLEFTAVTLGHRYNCQFSSFQGFNRLYFWKFAFLLYKCYWL